MKPNQEFLQKLITLGLYKPKNMTEEHIDEFLKGFATELKDKTNEFVKSQGNPQNEASMP